MTVADAGAGEPVLSDAIVAAGFAEAAGETGAFNLGLFGLTGVGKSTLVNAVFGADLARTGIGDPVTQDSRLYRHHTAAFGLYDTKGLEIGDDSDAVLRDLRAFVDRTRLGDPRDQLHVIWYAVRAGTRRIQPGEQRFIREVASLGIPVLLVMTQTPRTPDGQVHPEAAVLADSITALRLPLRGKVYFVNALGDPFAGVPAFGLPDLLDATADAAPEGVRTALAAAQRVSAAQKRAQAMREIARSEGRVRGRLFLRGLHQEWVRMFAAIATIYDVPDADSRAVLDQARSVGRLRRVLRTANAGMSLALFGPVAAIGAANWVRARRDERRWRRQARDPDPQAVEAAASAGPARRRRVRSGLSAGQVTAALGEAWLATCERVWSASYPEPASFADHRYIADLLAEDLTRRLPWPMRRA